MIEVVLNDRLGKKVRVKCNDDDTIGDLKKLVAAQTVIDKSNLEEEFILQLFDSGTGNRYYNKDGILEDVAGPTLLVISWIPINTCALCIMYADEKSGSFKDMETGEPY
ncbi:hypothetical protein EZV62_025410 [Acer yangbiense]|uniref:Ubiquitin-like domain-containing protein n=1 Tax=Acer yangbiense TaxID=1000413 RepID=A0A5C7GYH6_9ROSI|nr:hypothetical protein EZV62_025410 [Acer yangbiense]